ncbi:hypothetical protein [Reyranella sp.]|uniref:hypothetical protein n=1 Tax=Reyranella sp. TaxID=1929291 RepID=UPI003D0A17A7
MIDRLQPPVLVAAIAVGARPVVQEETPDPAAGVLPPQAGGMEKLVRDCATMLAVGRAVPNADTLRGRDG